MLHQIKCQVCGELFYIEEERCPFCYLPIGAKKLKLEDEDREKLKGYIFETLTSSCVGWVSMPEIRRKMLYEISSADLTSCLEEMVSEDQIDRQIIEGETLYMW